jgi:hypothetical protein
MLPTDPTMLRLSREPVRLRLSGLSDLPIPDLPRDTPLEGLRSMPPNDDPRFCIEAFMLSPALEPLPWDLAREVDRESEEGLRSKLLIEDPRSIMDELLPSRDEEPLPRDLDLDLDRVCPL